ncbi:MAG: hypothetical protein J5794_05315 [Lachnospiraceae bacterium]|nr:hypothetical protein [Lachnospiraceae bacterium]
MVRIFKCPTCGSALEYDGSQEMMICPHCASKQSVQTTELFESQGLNTVSGPEFQDYSGAGLKELHCPSCGATLLQAKDEHTAAMKCPFCLNPVLIESRLTGEFKPKYVLPFKLNKKQAKEAFKKWAKKGRLTPSSFKTDATLDQSQGLYVPSWLYTYTLNNAMTLAGEKVKREKVGNDEIVTTESYEIELTTEGTYERVPFNAEETVPHEVMEVLEPFDYTTLTEFALPYLSGYLAEKYHFSAAELSEKVKEALKEDMIAVSKDQITDFDKLEVRSDNVQFFTDSVEYVMLPVWMLNYQYGAKKYPLFMNGQTGKIHGKLPVSVGKVALLFGIVFAVIFLLLLILGWVL